MLREEAEFLGKVRARVIPILFAGILLGYIDRSNMAYAALQMNADLGLSPQTYGIAAGLFFLGYFAFEIPGTLALYKLGARFWMSFLVLCWGILSVLMAFVREPHMFYLLRFLLGVAEAGFFPGTILLMKSWVPAGHRAQYGAYFMTAVPFAMVLAGPISGVLLELHGTAGLSGWQWIFLVEGAPCFLLAIWMVFALPDSPDRAKWLSIEQKQFIANSLKEEDFNNQTAAAGSRWAILLDIRLGLLCMVAFGGPAVATGITFWLPQILSSFGLTPIQTGFLGALPFLLASISLWWWGAHSDRTREHRWHLALPLFAATVGLLGVLIFANPALKLLMLLVASLGMFSYLPVLWAASHSLFKDRSAPVGYGLISMSGALAGLIAPTAMGALVQVTGSHDSGILALVCIAFVATGAALAFGSRATNWKPSASVA